MTQITLNESISLWDMTAAEPAFGQTDTLDTETDVAIVGGGFTGNSTALHLAEKGIKCHVLESTKIGYGGSGRNVGLVNAGLWLPPQNIREQLGNQSGDHFVKVLGEAPEYVFSLIDKHAIQCEPNRNGTIHAAHSTKGFQELKERHQEWQRLKANVDLLDRKLTETKTGTNVFYGGLLDHRAGTINPMGYVRGLSRAARSAGAKISTGIMVNKLKRDANKWLLETSKGVLKANRIVIATNAYSDNLWPNLNRCFIMIHYFQVATTPLGNRTDTILPERQGVWDTAPIMFNVRKDNFGRILIGSMGRTHGRLTHRWAKQNIKRLFPSLGKVDIEKTWFGQIAMTPDHLPRIYQLEKNIFTPIGYNGRGITPGTIFGRDLANFLSTGQEDKLPLPIKKLTTAKSASIMSKLYSAAFSANQVFHSL